MSNRQNSDAIITIHKAATMTANQRRSIAAWMRRQATFLEKEGKKMASRHTSRYNPKVAWIGILLLAGLVVGACDLEKKEGTPAPVVMKEMVYPCEHAVWKTKQDGAIAKEPIGPGFQYVQEQASGNRAATSHCLPCQQATSPQERFVCEGQAANGEKG
jgi:hypothetical protein